MDSQPLKKAGLKITHPRLKVLDILRHSQHQHLSAETIYRQLLESGEEIALATIYRVLTQFEAAGLVIRHHFASDQSVFELNHGGHHDHIVCLDCHRVEEFYDPLIEKRQLAISQHHQFQLIDHTLTLYGECQRTNCPHRPPQD